MRNPYPLNSPTSKREARVPKEVWVALGDHGGHACRERQDGYTRYILPPHRLAERGVEKLREEVVKEAMAVVKGRDDEMLRRLADIGNHRSSNPYLRACARLELFNRKLRSTASAMRGKRGRK